MRGRILVRCMIFSICLGLPAWGAADPSRPTKSVEFQSYKEIESLFDELGYTPERWQAGIREVPRLYLTKIAPRWRDRVSKEVSVQTKKRLFFRALAPLALRSNEMILADRTRIEAIAKAGQPSDADRDWLAETATRYGVDDPSDFERLLRRVDVVPISLVLSQAAEESGWGTSRFAAVGNALFGQWTWSGEGIKPQNQRSDLGDHRIAAFETPLQSVMAYMQNLNTHRAYSSLRKRRARMRVKNERLSGQELAETLTSYSERGPDYVTSLHTIMRVNKLDPADDAYLGDGPTIHLVPVGAGSE